MTDHRAIPYPEPGARLTIPLELWQRTLDTIRTFGEEDSEALVFWGGLVVGRDLHVTGLYRPSHRPQGARVKLTSEETRWLLRALRRRDEKLLAQVHSHPELAFHSPGDENRAASFHRGYFSIVVPRYGAAVTDLGECAVFEFDGREFSELTEHEMRERLDLQSLVEERPRQDCMSGRL